MDTLLREHGVDRVDVLKVDIEGAEKEVFASCSSWIDRVGVLIVEFHDRLKDGCSDTVYAAAEQFPVRWNRGETTFFQRQACPPPRNDVTTNTRSSMPSTHRKADRSRIRPIPS
jgi:hypothetical protein